MFVCSFNHRARSVLVLEQPDELVFRRMSQVAVQPQHSSFGLLPVFIIQPIQDTFGWCLFRLVRRALIHVVRQLDGLDLLSNGVVGLVEAKASSPLYWKIRSMASLKW